jgi:hypothetical protein
MVLDSPWNAEIRKQFERHGVVDADFRSPRCFSGLDTKFLLDLGELRGLTILGDHIDLKPIEELNELRRLRLSTTADQPISLNAFPMLESLSLEWNRSVIGFADLRALKYLFINHPTKAIIPQIGEMSTLEELALFSCPAEDLTALGQLINLRKLRLVLFRKNRGNAFVGNLANLEEYFIQDSTGFTSFDPLENLRKIKKIAVSESGPYESLKPLRNLRTLEYFGIDSHVLDGDYSPVEDMAQLQVYGR